VELIVRDLWIGSEGTLGIITKATLKLVNKPLARRTFLIACRTDELALEAAAELMGSRINPAVLNS
jgi:glycolate oxidase